MRRKFFCFLIGCSAIFAQEYGVSDLIDVYSENGYQSKYEELELKKLESSYTELKKGNRNGAKFILVTDYSSEESDTFESSIKVSYDFFNIKSTYDYKESDWSSSIGVEKDIKDYIYSENSYDLSIFESEEKVTKNELEEEREEDILEIISLYKDYQDKLIEMDLYLENKVYLFAEYKTLEKEYEIGIENRLNYKYAKIKYENILRDIDNLSKEIEDLKNSFIDSYKIEISADDVLLPFDDKLLSMDINFDKIGQREVESLVYEKKKAEETEKYGIFLDKSPDMTLGADYLLDDDEWQISFTLSKTFGDYSSDILENKLEVEKYDIKIKEAEENNKLEKKKLKNEYESLKVEIDKYKSTAEVNEMEYLIKKEKYEQGNGDYIDYMDAYDQYNEAKSTYLKKVNEFKALIFEILNRR
jgi:hypothetical protein